MNKSSLKHHGPVSWMAGHPVAANLIMLTCIIGGLLFLKNIKQEVFPEFEMDIIRINIAYPGASPEEVESGLLLAIEDAVGNLVGIDEIISHAIEGSGTVTIDASADADMHKLVQEVQKEVDRISTFPEDAEEPIINVLSKKRRALSLVLYGDVGAKVLHELAEQFRDRLLQDPDITQVELQGVRELEIGIEIAQQELRRYRLSLSEIAQRISQSSIDLPGGSIKTDAGEILIRMKERKDYGQQFAQIPIITTKDGSEILLGDIAKINDGYAETDYSAFYNSLPAIMVQVYSTGQQSPIEVSNAVKRHIDDAKTLLPHGIHVEIRRDSSEYYAQRIDLLLRNSAIGLVLVFISLALFLELRLAFWVMMGIPIAFLGSFLVLPALGVTLNMISLFAFIIAIGIVVDDAIIIGENIYHYRQEGMPPMQAAIQGAREMAMPVTFSILTNIATFMPLLFVPGIMGKIFFMIPMVVITVFLLSLAESLFILPNHLGHLKHINRTGLQLWLYTKQQQFSHAFRDWVKFRYGAFLDQVLAHHYLTVLAAFALLFATLSYAVSGRMGMSMFPKIESNFAKVTVTLPYGTPVEKTHTVVQQIVSAARSTADNIKDGDQLLRGVFAEIGKDGAHQAYIIAYLAPPDIREKIINTEQFSQLWRETSGEIIGVDTLLFESDAGGPGSGAALTIELNHRNLEVLEQASQEIAAALNAYPIVNDVDDGFSVGKQQLNFTLLPEGKSLGLTAEDVARQVRNAFYGTEVLRQQRGRNEIKIMVRLPKIERVSERNIDDLILWTPDNQAIPLRDVVQIQRDRAYTEINRRNGRRNVQIQAGVSPRSKAVNILNDLKLTELPRLLSKYPGLQFSFQGRQADMAESISSLKLSFVVALLAIYTMLAIPFKSYTLPLIVIFAIPFGIIGAIFGHLIMGYDLSLLSLLGIIALSGIVVNDSLVLINYANKLSINGDYSAVEVIKMAAIQRFRPIVLTTLTTFCGLAPMILETSRQARMLIPMAISIGFGILFATIITLILIPSMYLVVHDFKVYIRQLKSDGQSESEHHSES